MTHNIFRRCRSRPLPPTVVQLSSGVPTAPFRRLTVALVGGSLRSAAAEHCAGFGAVGVAAVARRADRDDLRAPTARENSAPAPSQDFPHEALDKGGPRHQTGAPSQEGFVESFSCGRSISRGEAPFLCASREATSAAIPLQRAVDGSASSTQGRNVDNASN